MTPLIFISGSYGQGLVAMETFINVLTFLASAFAIGISITTMLLLWPRRRKPPRD